jgi:hypothetical protein
VGALLAMRPPSTVSAGTTPPSATPAGPAPVAALAATACAVTDRVQRLLEPPSQARRVRHGLALITVTLLLVLGSGLVITLAGPLAAHAMALVR